MNRGTNNQQRTFSIAVIFLVALLQGCYGKIAKPGESLKVGVKEQALEYDYTAYAATMMPNMEPDILSQRKSMGHHALWNCVEDYCTQMHKRSFDYAPPDGRYVGYLDGTHTRIPDSYIAYRKHLCMADLFMEFVNTVDLVEISEFPKSVPSKFINAERWSRWKTSTRR